MGGYIRIQTTRVCVAVVTRTVVIPRPALPSLAYMLGNVLGFLLGHGCLCRNRAKS